MKPAIVVTLTQASLWIFGYKHETRTIGSAVEAAMIAPLILIEDPVIVRRPIERKATKAV